MMHGFWGMGGQRDLGPKPHQAVGGGHAVMCLGAHRGGHLT